MNNCKVEICGVNTSKLTVLRESEKIALLKRAHGGDAGAKDALVMGNLRLVLSVIQRFLNRGEQPDDLFQVGCIGLIKAIDRFDLSQNVRFSTYAVPMILGEIRRFLRDNNTVRVSRSLRDTAYHAMQAKERLQSERGREPSIGEIAAELSLPVTDVVAALESVVEPMSLYEPAYGDGEDSAFVFERVSASSGESDWLCEISFRQAFEKLSERERRILTLRFIAGRTQTDVAGDVGISQAQVSRLEKTALEKIKSAL